MSITEDNQRNGWWVLAVSHSLIVLLMVCLTISFAQFFGLFIPVSRVLPVLGGGIVMEAILTYRVTRKLSPFSTEWLLARGAEWVVILAIVKLVTELQHGIPTFMSDLAAWQENFAYAFFTGEYLSMLFVLFFVWACSTLYASDLAEMEGSDFFSGYANMNNAEIAQVRSTAALYGMHVDDDTLPSNCREIHNRLLSRTLTIGILMVVIAGFLRQDRITIWQGQSLAQVSVINVILYFIFGIALSSLTNLSALRTAWRYEHVAITLHLTPRWAFYCLTFIIGLGILTFILPTSYSLGLLDTLMYVLGVLRIIVEFVIGVIMLPVLLIFKLLSNLLGGGNGNDNPGESQPINPVETPAPIGIQNPSLPWWDVVRSSLFWAIFFIIIGIATYQYIQQNRVLFSALKSLSLWRWLMQAWHWLKVKVKVVRCGLASAVKDGLVKINAIRSKPVQKSEWRIANPYRMTPRQQIIFFYLALARRGREAGFPRHASQTPYEYAQFITYELADERDALIELTEGFIDARYSLHDVTPEKANKIKQAWARVRDGLRSKSKRSGKKKSNPTGS